MMLKSFTTRASVVAIAAASMVAIYVPPSQASDVCAGGNFCAYQLGNYTNKILESGATSGSVDVTNGIVTGGKNRMSTRKWCGRNQQDFRDDDVVFYWAPLTNSDLEGTGNDNKIDIFDVVGVSTGCPN